MSDLRRRWWVVVALLALVVAIGLAVSWWLQRSNETIWIVQRGDLVSSLDVPGRIVAMQSAVARAGFDTRVRVVTVQPGDMVEAGDIVAVLDDAPLVSRLREAERQLLQAEAALAQLEWTDGPLEARLRAEEQRRSALESYAQAEAQLAERYVLAPTDGIVTEVTTSEGAPVGAGTVVVRIAAMEVLGVSATIDEVDARYLEEGEAVRVTVDALPGWEGRGRVVSLGKSAVQQAGVVGFPLLVRLDETSDALRPGMTAVIHVDTVLRRAVLLVPERAVRTVGERAFVVVDEGGRRVEREVTLGLRSGGFVEVAAGLAEGERVVLP